MTRLVTIAGALLLAAGCTVPADSTGNKPMASPSAPTGTTEPVETPPAEMTAEQLGEALADEIPTMKVTVVYTEESDPNDLLGRPNGYTSKIAFSDSRVGRGDVQGTDKDAIERGGSVEVYPDAAGAKARSEYIQSILKAGGIFGPEYHYLAGAALLRVTGNLTPAVARDYQRALATVGP